MREARHYYTKQPIKAEDIIERPELENFCICPGCDCKVKLIRSSRSNYFRDIGTFNHTEDCTYKKSVRSLIESPEESFTIEIDKGLPYFINPKKEKSGLDDTELNSIKDEELSIKNKNIPINLFLSNIYRKYSYIINLIEYRNNIKIVDKSNSNRKIPIQKYFISLNDKNCKDYASKKINYFYHGTVKTISLNEEKRFVRASFLKSQYNSSPVDFLVYEDSDKKTFYDLREQYYKKTHVACFVRGILVENTRKSNAYFITNPSYIIVCSL